MTDMEQQMIRALAAIDAELGMPEDGCSSTERTLTAIRLLHSMRRDDAAEIERLRAALQAVSDAEANDEAGLCFALIEQVRAALRPNDKG